MPGEELESRFRDPLLEPSARFRPVRQRELASVQVSQNKKNELLHDGPLLRCVAPSMATGECIMKSYVL